MPTDNNTGVKFVSPDDLLLDARNPRLVGLVDESAKELATQEGLLRFIWETMALDELAASIAADGFYRHEPLLVEPPGKDGKCVVIEGNRRLATVRLLLDERLRREFKATHLPLPKGDKLESLRNLPVWETSREKAWQAIGFKHVNGPLRWSSYAKARYIARLHGEHRKGLEEIAKSIGDNHKTTFRLWRALTVILQAEKMGVFHREDRWKPHFAFSHLYTGLDYSGIAEFIGLKPESALPDADPVPEERKKELGELLVWIYGSRKTGREPVVKAQNPDLRRLNQALQSKDGIDMLRAVSSLEEAAEAAEGDRAVFYDCLLRAKVALEKALGKTAGYGGDPELLRTVKALHALVDNLVRLIDADNAEQGREEENKNGRSS